MHIHIHELTSKDLNQAFLDTLTSLSEVKLSPEQALPILRRRLEQGIHTYVASEGDDVIGTASLFIEQKFLHGGGLVGHIEDVAVHRNVQLRGVGTALVEHATEEARRLGCYKVILDCFDRLVPFYARLGYRTHNLGMRKDF